MNREAILMQSLPHVLDLLGTFVFALSGGMAGVKRRLDLFGVIVLSFAAATAGGIARDVLIGAIPPEGLNNWRYVAVSLGAGLVTFFFPARVTRRWNPVLLLDAAGLALFAVTGAHKALLYGVNPVTATLLGMLTAIGGGMVRDILLAQTPTVLQAELYAVAALLGAGVVVIGNILQLPSNATTLVGAGLCFSLRIVAIRRNWRLPIARADDPPDK